MLPPPCRLLPLVAFRHLFTRAAATPLFLPLSRDTDMRLFCRCVRMLPYHERLMLMRAFFASVDADDDDDTPTDDDAA